MIGQLFTSLQELSVLHKATNTNPILFMGEANASFFVFDTDVGLLTHLRLQRNRFYSQTPVSPSVSARKGRRWPSVDGKRCDSVR